MENEKPLIKWIWNITNVDVDTGEIIDKETMKRDYEIIKNTQIYQKHERGIIIRKITRECRKKGQLSLF